MNRSDMVRIVDGYDDGSDESREVMEGYDVSGLENEFGLIHDDAIVLWKIVHGSDPERCAYGVEDKNAVVFLEQIQESIHQSYDGWSDEDKLVIQAYLSDITEAVYLVIKCNTDNPF